MAAADDDEPIELMLTEDCRLVRILLPRMPVAEVAGKLVTGVDLTVEGARALAVELIRWSVLAEMTEGSRQ